MNEGQTVSTVDGYNADILGEQREKLRQLFPEVFSEDKIDWDKLKATLGADIELGERYGLSWKGKSNVFAKIQEKTVSTLHPQPEESVDWDTTQNMFIEGDNLETFKILHKAYYGKIKMIYIDPPYNTGNDFVYNDDFKKTRREQALEEGAIDDEGNVTRDDGLRVNTGGHKHSNWLDMMYPRLFLARNLLRQDGVIFVSIDDNEVHNLRLMMNEIFGEENFVDCLVWKKRYGGGAKEKYYVTLHEYVLVYARNINSLDDITVPITDESIKRYYTLKDDNYKNRGPFRTHPLEATKSMGDRPNLIFPISAPDGTEVLPARQWLWSRERVSSALSKGEIHFIKTRDGWTVHSKQYLYDEEGNARSGKMQSLIDDVYSQHGTNEIIDLFGNAQIFSFPKPTKLLKSLINSVAGAEDIFADFFGGSGSLAHAVEELNAEDGGARKWVVAQLPELTDEKSEAHKAGYKTIADISRERIRRAGAKISKDFADKIAERETSLDLGFRSYVLGDSNFKKWNELVADPDEIRQQALDSLNPLEDGITDSDLLTEILLKRGVSPLAQIETHDGFVFVPSENLAISLSRHMTEELFTEILAKSPSQIILLDQAFNNDLNLKTNLILQAEKQSIAVEVL